MQIQTLTRDQVIQLAQLKITDPQLEAFRTRLLIAYSTGLRLELLLEAGKQHIESNCLVIPDEKNGKILCIPLHRRIIRIINSYGDHFPTIRKADVAKYNHQLMKALGITIEPYKIRENEKWVEKDTPSTHWLRRTMLLHMEEGGLLPEDMSLLFGEKSDNPEQLNKGWERELNRLFRRTFFKHLMYLERHHSK
jgi:hypothetical protein